VVIKGLQSVAWSRTTARVAADRAERTRLGANAHAFFLAHYERTFCCDAWAALITDVLQA
jgi:hypothetical protein